MESYAFNPGMDEKCSEAIEKAGGPVALAKAIGDITSQAISAWKRVPPGRVLDVEKATGISRHVLRPDIFGVPPAGPDASQAGAGPIVEAAE